MNNDEKEYATEVLGMLIAPWIGNIEGLKGMTAETIHDTFKGSIRDSSTASECIDALSYLASYGLPVVIEMVQEHNSEGG